MRFALIVMLAALVSCAGHEKHPNRKMASEPSNLLTVYRCNISSLNQFGIGYDVSLVDGGDMLEGRNFIRIDKESRAAGNVLSEQAELKIVSKSLGKNGDKLVYEGMLAEGKLTVVYKRLFKSNKMELVFEDKTVELSCNLTF